ncbi:nuclear transport factor 2 family protein [Aeromicrobium tamlense]|uniref:Ketosteroid isomerase-like protein n=1 Tax=Aeromicrobium tamlense TaxID=375541 RepID=A0A8I0KKR5_9ACTN|nr:MULTISPECIES: nuclear transport factor 2 family protein [Aeromicrobium]MBD1269183.1 nuclear transport factor 2 family protein [Aeromicrobium tamlense]NYI36908.1 ketosteroid isomerase-like protein [Aeromicrobium tamlense]
MNDRHPHVQLLDRIIAAAEAGDPTDLAEIYAPDGVIWHNHDGVEQTVEENARVLTGIAKRVTDRRYTDRRIQLFDGGVVQQHVLRGTNVRSGEPVELHACVVVTVNEDGRIARLDEYIDSAEAARFSG